MLLLALTDNVIRTKPCDETTPLGITSQIITSLNSHSPHHTQQPITAQQAALIDQSQHSTLHSLANQNTAGCAHCPIRALHAAEVQITVMLLEPPGSQVQVLKLRNAVLSLTIQKSKVLVLHCSVQFLWAGY